MKDGFQHPWQEFPFTGQGLTGRAWDRFRGDRILAKSLRTVEALIGDDQEGLTALFHILMYCTDTTNDLDMHQDLLEKARNTPPEKPTVEELNAKIETLEKIVVKLIEKTKDGR
jgi:hypothetical protein